MVGALAPHCSLPHLWLRRICSIVLPLDLFAKRKSNNRVNKALLAAAIVMFALSTAHIVTELVKATRIFVSPLQSADRISHLLTDIQRGALHNHQVIVIPLITLRSTSYSHGLLGI